MYNVRHERIDDADDADDREDVAVFKRMQRLLERGARETKSCISWRRVVVTLVILVALAVAIAALAVVLTQRAAGWETLSALGRKLGQELIATETQALGPRWRHARFFDTYGDAVDTASALYDTLPSAGADPLRFIHARRFAYFAGDLRAQRVIEDQLDLAYTVTLQLHGSSSSSNAAGNMALWIVQYNVTGHVLQHVLASPVALPSACAAGTCSGQMRIPLASAVYPDANALLYALAYSTDDNTLSQPRMLLELEPLL